MTDTSSEPKMVPSSSQPTKEQYARRPSGPNDIKRFRVNRKEDMDLAFEESRQEVITEEGDDEEEYKCKNSDEHEVHNSSHPKSDVFIVIDRPETTTVSSGN
ncbi:unnamed protein product [Cylicocyclus nassatus]|uniref:Uncharacterized protein n=1 Tax=Cylicocyclus nassatus TaxID=53992 RepID=A0AA36DLK6_CYLNA|nr:unnamed protein product [Cylicocyclus nassatus]